MRSHPEYRVALGPVAPIPQGLHHSGLASPQGFDPLLPAQYKNLVDRIGHFRTNREFDLDPANEKALQLLGVRYFIGAGNTTYGERFRLLKPDDRYYKVFEYLDARPAYAWDAGSVELKLWQPERRAFTVRSTAGGRFRLSEQLYPGWTATIDGAPAPIDRCDEAFQCVAVSPGEHRIEFQYRSRSLPIGAAISLFTIALLLLTRYGAINKKFSGFDHDGDLGGKRSNR